MALERTEVTAVQLPPGGRHRPAGRTSRTITSKLDALKTAALALQRRLDLGRRSRPSTSLGPDASVAVALLAGAGIGGQSIQVDRLASSAQHGFDLHAEPSTRRQDHDATTLDARTPPAAPTVTIDVAADATAADVADADQRQRRARPSTPRWSRTRRHRAARPVRAQDRRGLGLHGRHVALAPAARARTRAYVAHRRRRSTPPYRVDGGAAAVSRLERRRERDPGRAPHAQGRHHGPVTVTVTTQPAIDRDAIKKKIKALRRRLQRGRRPPRARS